jgi:hypothetical protein
MVKGCLPLCDLPQVSLLEALLACKVPPLPGGADEQAHSPLPLELGEFIILMPHAHCVTLKGPNRLEGGVNSLIKTSTRIT